MISDKKFLFLTKQAPATKNKINNKMLIIQIIQQRANAKVKMKTKILKLMKISIKHLRNYLLRKSHSGMKRIY